MVGRKEQERREREARIRAKIRETERTKYRKQAREYEAALEAVLPDIDIEVRYDDLWGKRYDPDYDPDRDLISHDLQPVVRYVVTVRLASGEPQTFRWTGMESTLQEIRQALGL